MNPVVKGGYCTGALAGYANGATVTRCSAIGAKVEASGERAGGLVGFVENGSSFSQCYALGDVSSTSGYVGGFVGYVEDSPTFSECFACGSVTATGDNVGGFVGELYDTPSLTDCYSLADVKGNRYVGGFVGQIYYYDGAVTRCYSAGSASGSSEIGGFAGRQYRGSPTFTDCFRVSDSLADVGAADVAGVTALSDARSKGWHGVRLTEESVEILIKELVMLESIFDGNFENGVYSQPVTGIFAAKNLFGWKDTREVHQETVSVEVTPDQISSRYGAAIPTHVDSNGQEHMLMDGIRANSAAKKAKLLQARLDNGDFEPRKP